jgi:hypothetical protein
MSWLYSQALVEEFSLAICSDGEPSAQLNVMPTPHKFWRNDKTMEALDLSRFGLTCRLLTEDHGAALLTWFLEGFPARTSALQVKAQASQDHAQACGPTWRASLARFDPVSCGWKTAQLSLLGDSELSSVIWPRSGMTADGQCWELPMSVPITRETDSGWWPTPCATDNSNRKPSDNIHISATGLPKHVGANGEKSQMRLSQAVQMWPTPTVCGNYNRKGASATSGDGLATAVKTWRTPTASDANKWSNESLRERQKKGRQIRLNTQVSPEGGGGGILNPNWVEWLMGWPIGWTDLKPLETGKFHCAQPKHSECSQVNC